MVNNGETRSGNHHGREATSGKGKNNISIFNFNIFTVVGDTDSDEHNQLRALKRCQILRVITLEKEKVHSTEREPATGGFHWGIS